MQTILALLVFLTLWFNGKFYPLLLMPFLFVKFYCRESLSRIGLSSKNLRLSLFLGASSSLLAIMAYYPIFLGYLGKRIVDPLDTSVIFMDLVWYPVYEELSYRGFFLGFFAWQDSFNGANLVLNLVQALMFVSVHKHHVLAGFPLLLLPVFLFGFLSGMVFLKTRNTYGCILSHILLNGAAHLLALAVRYPP